MSPTKPVTSRRRALIAVAVVLLLAAASAVLLLRTRSRPVPGGGGMEGMAGMSGMGAGPAGTIQITADQIRTFGITFGTAERRVLTSDVRATGIVTVAEPRVTDVTPRFSGFVERLYVNATGQSVRRGQPLAAIYSPELVAAQQELLVARRLQHTVGQSGVPGVPTGTTDLTAAARQRLRLLDVSPSDIDELLRSGRVRRALTLRSPASGVVLEKNVVEGQAVQAGMKIYTLADLSEVWVDAELRETDAALVRVGSGVDVTLPAEPGRSIRGRIGFIYPTLDSTSRTVRARVIVPNGSGRLRPGMYATVRIVTPTRTALAVPEAAIIHTGERTMVFVDRGGGQLAPREVHTGSTGGGYTEITSGLSPGERVVTSAQFLLDSESNLAEVMKSMLGSGAR